MNKYLSIKNVSEITGLSSSNIRYYEKEGLIHIPRNSTGIRIFTEKEIQWLSFLKKLRDMAVPIAKMKEYATLRAQGNSTATARKHILAEHRKIVLEKIDLLKSLIELLDVKIEYYEKLEEDK